MAVEALHCNLNQNGVDHAVCTEDVSVQVLGDPEVLNSNDEKILRIESNGSPKSLHVSETESVKVGVIPSTKGNERGRALLRLTDKKLERMGIVQETQRQHVLQQVLHLRVREEVRNLQLLTQASLDSSP
ncbi:sterile alpha motif domain-containing protein 12 [Rhincodon typus]|uniref:sterile alpha motif domain-containing protein 12 n=1 Tax=Rhincodon typus TaxID=259920 RepID=UPI00202E0046|nr:sterile alpha motif domain-containing protein 12 [Rhincodon typus]